MIRNAVALLIPVSIAVTLCLAALHLLTHSRILRLLRDRHPSTWQRLGSPGLIMGNSIGSSLAMLKFMRQKAHRGLADPEMERLGDRWRLFGKLYVAAYLLFAVCIFALFAT